MTKYLVGLLSLTFVACTAQKTATNVQGSFQGLRELTADERAEDFDQLAELFQNFYGPLEYKKQVIGVDAIQTIQALKAKAILAKSDEEFAGYIQQVGAALKDGHVQIRVVNTASGISRYKIPVTLHSVEGKALVADVTEDIKKTFEISIGDEVTEIDGQTPQDLLRVALKYRSLATDLSNQQNIVYALLRPSYMTELVPTSGFAKIKVVKANSKTMLLEIPWETERYNSNLKKSVNGSGVHNLSLMQAQDYGIDAHRLQLGQVKPVFLSDTAQSVYKFVKVYPSDSARKRFGLKDEEKPDIYAALYKFNNKSILLARIATYSPPDDSMIKTWLKAYRALLSEYQDLVDVLVIDQTHNPGGSVSYCGGMYNMLATEGDVQAVQQCRADRKWINDFKVVVPGMIESEAEKLMSQAWGLQVEKAYDAGQLLSPPLSFFADGVTVKIGDFQWKKPALVLIDEMAGSCGDLFPMLVKANKHIKLFGRTTMGLGGNVDQVGILNNSQIEISMTRGLFHPHKENGIVEPQEYVENNGVSPDIEYAHTVQDVRGGYLQYIKTFSEKALEQIK